MKRVFMVGVFAFVFSVSAHAQIGVVELGAMTQNFLEWSHLEKIIRYAQMVDQQIKAVEHAYDQYQALVRAEERAWESLKGIQNVHSYGEFMGWYNRQLDRSREVDYRYQNIGIQIGGKSGKTYGLDEIRDIPGAAKNVNKSYWENEFTVEQRRDMWVDAGLTPANYAYQNTWANHELTTDKGILVRRGIIKEENALAYQRNQRLVNESMDPNTGDAARSQIDNALNADNNNVLREIAEMTAEGLERDYIREQMGKTPPPDPDVSYNWNSNYFGDGPKDKNGLPLGRRID